MVVFGGPFSTITGYVEANSNELYLVSYVLNTKELSPLQIFKLGVGIRVGLRK